MQDLLKYAIPNHLKKEQSYSETGRAYFGREEICHGPELCESGGGRRQCCRFLKKLVIIHGIVFVLCVCETMYPSERSV